MRAPVRFGVILTVLLGASPLLAAPGDVLRECASRAGGAAPGLAQLERECPDLSAALTELGYGQLLGEEWRSRLTSPGLLSLAALADHYATADRHFAPDSARVRGIVDELARSQVRNRSPWDLFLEWLRSLLGDDADHSLSWLDRWLEKLGNAGGVLTYVMGGSFLAILLVAAVFLVRELRASGVLARRRPPQSPGSPSTAAVVGIPVEPRLEEVPLRDRPGLLLRQLVNCLARQGSRIRINRHLTHRELIDRAPLEGAERQSFANVAALAETMLYGRLSESTDGAMAHEVGQVVDEGRRLLSRLEQPSTGTSTGI